MYPAIRATGADVAALSVDSAERSAALRDQLTLPFPILGDVTRAVVQAWDLYNPREMGGIAVPAVFVIDPDLRVRWRSVDSTRKRVALLPGFVSLAVVGVGLLLVRRAVLLGDFVGTFTAEALVRSDAA